MTTASKTPPEAPPVKAPVRTFAELTHTDSVSADAVERARKLIASAEQRLLLESAR